MKTLSAILLVVILTHATQNAWENLTLPKPPKHKKTRRLFLSKVKEMGAKLLGDDKEFQKQRRAVNRLINAQETKILDATKTNQVKKSKIRERLNLIRSKMAGLSDVVKNSVQDLQTIIKFQEEQKASEKGGERI
jgi:hypothetical protein